MQIQITSFYRFIPIDSNSLPAVQNELTAALESSSSLGLVILAEEGLNGTVAGSPAGITQFESFLDSFFGMGDWMFKRSFASQNPFKRLRVRVREEIVTSGHKELKPQSGPPDSTHLSPAAWHRYLSESPKESYVLLDVRNAYETEVGLFKGAEDPGIETFQDFEDYLDNAGIPQEKPVLMYCTGGIRCEKALLEMKTRGYQEVYQLEGGILRYMEEFPEGHFEGECFVFDHRVALDKNLEPSQIYTLCPHCGDPGKETTVCFNCGVATKICHRCRESAELNTCSKNCAHHAGRKLKNAADFSLKT